MKEYTFLSGFIGFWIGVAVVLFGVATGNISRNIPPTPTATKGHITDLGDITLPKSAPYNPYEEFTQGSTTWDCPLKGGHCFLVGKEVPLNSVPQVKTIEGNLNNVWLILGQQYPQNTQFYQSSIDIASSSPTPTIADFATDKLIDTHVEWLGHMFWNFDDLGRVYFEENTATGTSTDCYVYDCTLQ